VEEVFHGSGFRVVIRDDFTSVGSKLNIAKRLWEEGVQGIVFSGFAEPRIRQWVLEEHVPSIVVGNATLYQQDLARVCADNVGGVQQMLRHLVSQGHTDIACYAVGLENYHGIQERARSFEFGMEEMGLTPIRDFMFREVHSPEVARKAAEIFMKMPVKPTAILCATDREAFEIMHELRMSGMEIPRQVSIVGFENSLSAHISEPSLTSVEIFAMEMGRVAATFMRSEMQTRQIPVSMVLPAKVIVRNSVQPKGIAIANLIAERAKKTTKIPLPEI
jgi:DNA-binding LacI/PurR family transcriptional regulator